MTECLNCIMAVTGVFATGGGIASVNRLVLRSFLEEGCQVEVFALVETEANIPAYAREQVQYHVFSGNKFAFAQALWKTAASQQDALIFCDHINVAAALSPVRLALKRPYVVWVHGTEVFPPNPTWEGKIGLNLADRRLTSSQFTRDIVLKQSPAKPAVACDLALEPDRWGHSIPERPPETGKMDLELAAIDGRRSLLGDQVILHVGRMNSRQRHKGHEVILRSFPEIIQENPRAQLVLAGTGDDYAYLKAIGQSLPAQMQQAIFMPGFVSDEDLTKLYRHCRLFAMPSQAEGFGIVYLEAMRWARPCVGSRVDAASCVIVDGETGLLVDDPRSIEELAAKINWLLAHPAEAAAMGNAGYQLVRQRHLFPAFKERFIQALYV